MKLMRKSELYESTDKAKYIKSFLENEIGMTFTRNTYDKLGDYYYGNIIDHHFELRCHDDYFRICRHVRCITSSYDFDHNEIREWFLEHFSSYEKIFRVYEPILNRLRVGVNEYKR